MRDAPAYARARGLGPASGSESGRRGSAYAPPTAFEEAIGSPFPPQDEGVKMSYRGLRYPFTPLAGQEDPEWVVLSCPSQETLRYEGDLRGWGLAGWAPAIFVSRRVPRSRSRRWELKPVLPGFLFLEVRELPRFLELGHPFGDGSDWAFPCKPLLVPLRLAGSRDPVLHAVSVSRRVAEHFRTLDDRTVPRSSFDEGGDPRSFESRFPLGAKVHIVSGLLEGMEGVVEGWRPRSMLQIAVNFSPIPVVIGGSQVELLPV